MIKNLVRGLAAGAAGTTVLNAVTYLDMAVRGRPASDSPQKTVETMADRLAIDIPGDGSERDNRLDGLGALSGIATGVTVGAVAGLIRLRRLPIPGWLGAALIGGVTMAVTDTVMARTGVSDPRTWSRSDWAADAVPHLIFGAVTWAVLGARGSGR